LEPARVTVGASDADHALTLISVADVSVRRKARCLQPDLNRDTSFTVDELQAFMTPC